MTEKDFVSQIMDDIPGGVNFEHLPITCNTICRYSLLKSYCMPLYGSLLWELGLRAMNLFMFCAENL